MNTMPVIQPRETTLYKEVAAIGSPIQKLLDRTKRWVEESRFMDKEAGFFFWMVFKSQTLSNGKKKEDLAALRQKLLDFKNGDLEDYLRALRAHEAHLTRQSNCRYPPTNFGAIYEAHQDLEGRMEELDAVLKGLKTKAFDAVGEFLTIRIF
jgi:hypothetical protein